jgi:hypothetical protein
VIKVGDEVAWISVHQQIRDHRKTRNLYRTLNINRAEAIGTLTLIWTWAIDNCNKEGELLSVTKEDIADAAYWRGNPESLYSALVETKWIDELEGKMYLHDWGDFNKPFYDYITRKEKDKQRKRTGLSTEIPQETPRNGVGNSEEMRGEFHDSPSPSPSPSPSQEQVIPLSSNKFADDSIELSLSSELYNLMLENNPNAKKPILQTWAKSVDLMIRRDKRSVEDIKRVMKWSQKDEFWRKNILSTEKLREKFDQLTMGMKSASKPKTPNFGADRTPKTDSKYDKFYL